MAKPCAYHNYRSLELKHWVDQKIHREGISRVMVFSSSMAQYANAGGAVRSVIDFVDVDSEKWRQYSRRHRWPLSWVYRREGERLLAYEREVAQWASVFVTASASVFVTEEEASVFREKAPDLTGSIRSIVNGVDAEFFSPDRSYEKPFSGDEPTIVFTGMMDYWANIDAVDFFFWWRCGRRGPAKWSLTSCPVARTSLFRHRSAHGRELTAILDGVRTTSAQTWRRRPYTVVAANSSACTSRFTGANPKAPSSSTRRTYSSNTRQDGWREMRASHDGVQLTSDNIAVVESLLDSGGRQLLVWKWYWVDGRRTTSPLHAKLIEIAGTLFEGSPAAAGIVVYAPVLDDEEAAKQSMTAFLDSALPGLAEELRALAETN